MSSLSSRKLRAPQADGAALFDPPLAEATGLVAANRQAAADWDRLSGAPLSKWRDQARCTLVSVAAINAGEGQLSEAEEIRRAAQPSIFTGHQPELFHPGVWFKNFLASAIAKQTGGRAFHLIVDNDAIHSATIRVPAGRDSTQSTVEIPFDQPGPSIPWSERTIIDLQTFSTFPARAGAAMDAGKGHRLLDRLWPHAQSYIEKHRELHEHPNVLDKLLLGECLAYGRNNLERELGLDLGDQPIRWLCFGRPYDDFVDHLLTRVEELYSIHNRALAAYRIAQRIRGDARPVPDLAQEGEWLEMPLWMWTHGQPERRRTFARRVGKSWELTDLQGITTGPNVREATGRCPWDLHHKKYGLRVYPRALITTMYARLVLSDLFIHGIGGAKYDELTDEIIRRFFGIEPPRYLTATATFRLPIERPGVTVEDVRQSSQTLRDVRFRPETLVGHPLVASDPALERELQGLAAEKRDYLRSHTLRRGSHDVFSGLDRINASMSEKLQPLAAHLRAEHARRIELLQQARTLGSREFSFVLYPEEYLVPRLLALASAEK
jgi:hypothetical protein